MKKVLILAYDFPPYVSVGGLRPYNWYKYLAAYDVYPIVVTRQWSNNLGGYLDYVADSASSETLIETSENGTLIRTPYVANVANRMLLKYGEHKYRNIRRGITAFYEFTQWVWNIGPKSALYFAARDYLRENKVDAIIATGDPFILFRYASDLSREFNTPWIADYRDPWSQNKFNRDHFILRNWSRFFEKKTLQNVSFISTVSEFFSHQIASLVKGKEIKIIPNGYDPQAIEKVSSIGQSSDVLRIGFVGTIYKYHPIHSVMKVLAQFVAHQADAKIMLNLYGINNEEEIKKMLRDEFPQLEQHINIVPRMANEALVAELAKNNLFLLFNYYSSIGTKIYDYLALKRVILLCYANDAEANDLKKKYYSLEEFEGLSHHLQEDLIHETHSGHVVQDSEHLLDLLVPLYSEFIQKGFIACDTINETNYSRKFQTKHLASYIHQM